MKLLVRRVWRLESRAGTYAPLAWETPGWEQLSDTELLGELERTFRTPLEPVDSILVIF